MSRRKAKPAARARSARSAPEDGPGDAASAMAAPLPARGVDQAADLTESITAFDDLVSAFEEADRAIDQALASGAASAKAAANGAEAGLMDGETMELDLDEVFAEFERDEADEADEADSSPEQQAAPGPARRAERSRPADRRIETAVANLVRLLTQKREVTRQDLDIVFGITTAKLVEAANAEAVTIFLTEPLGVRFAHVAYSRALYKGNPQAEARFKSQIRKLKEQVLPLGTGIVGRAIADRRSHLTLDAPSDAAFFKGIRKATGFAVSSMMTVPMSFDGLAYGAIQVLNKSPASGEQFFSTNDLRLCEEVAEYSARAIHMARNPGHEWPPEELARYIARLAKLEYIDLADVEVDPKLLQLIGEDNLGKFRILPLKKLGTRAIKAAIDNPLDLARRDGFQLATELDLEVLVVAPGPQIQRVIDRAFLGPQADVRKRFLEDLEEKRKEKQKGAERIELARDADEESAPVIKLVNSIVEDAYARGSSDIHIEPFEKDVSVRYRTDGVLHEVMRLPREAIRPLTARLKIMAELDISEQRLPQDGRIRFKDYTRTPIDIDLRVATAPMIWGEKTVMRILDKQSATVGVDKLGYSEPNLKAYLECVEAPYGMILHTGPTGSGKTTSLYAALAYCNEPDMNIQTAEDPVEYVMHGINQMQMKPSIGLTFARALRSYLRQDPDIILVGEIRDLETASIAIEAALTGHQVFSTLHTNDAAGTVVRLVEMGIEPFLITGSLLCVVAQRLMRRLCPRCRLPHVPDDAERRLLGLAEGAACELFIANPQGCGHCNGAGYKGRTGTHEILVMNEAVRAIAAHHGASASDIHKVAVAEAAMIPLFDDAMAKVKAGVTDLAEALRNVKQV